MHVMQTTNFYSAKLNIIYNIWKPSPFQLAGCSRMELQLYYSVSANRVFSAMDTDRTPETCSRASSEQPGPPHDIRSAIAYERTGRGTIYGEAPRPPPTPET